MNIIKKILSKKQRKAVSIRSYNIFGVDEDASIDSSSLKKMNDFLSSIDEVLDINEQEFVKIYTNEALRINLVDSVVEKMCELHDFGKCQLIYKKEYEEKKNKLIDLLARLFGNHLMLESLEVAVKRLEEHDVFPANSLKDFIMQTPLSRWY